MTQPLPSEADLSSPFWQGALNDKLRMQQCCACGLHRYPDAPICAACRSMDSRWVDVPGAGTVKAWCRFHRSYFEGFPMPHTVLLIQLDEGPQLFANWESASAQRMPEVGMRVEVVFEWIGEHVKMPKFRPV